MTEGNTRLAKRRGCRILGWASIALVAGLVGLGAATPFAQDRPAETPAAASPESPPPPPPPLPLAAPADPIAAKAYRVLETHCARCHQSGRLNRPAPAAGFGNIQHLNEIAADPVLVRPGDPDGSRLYTLMLRRLMPFDVHQEQAPGEEPTGEELNAVRAWIGRLPPAPGCPEQRMIGADAVAEILTRAAEKAGWEVGRQRFISLAHLHNACARPEALAIWREGIARLLNSLSWKPAPVRLEAIDEAQTILRFDLDDLGWVPVHWERIVATMPNAGGHLGNLPAAATQPFGSRTPVARADWLAETILKAPLYYDLLGLPAIGSEIHKILQVNAEAARRTGAVLRAPVKESRIARSSRLIERFQMPKGMMWSTFDAVPRDGQRDLADSGVPPGLVPPHDAALTLFQLPNGLAAFFIANRRGERLDQVPADIARRSVAGRQWLRAGLDCLSCHAGGPALPNPDAAPSDAGRAAAGDRVAFAEAARRAGLGNVQPADGVDAVVALARQFTRPVHLARAAADLGVSTAALLRLGGDPRTPAGLIVRRLTHGLVTRAELEAHYGALLQALGTAAPADALPASPIPPDEIVDPGPVLRLLPDKPFYAAGEALSLTVRTSADCHLTLVGIDQRGRGTVIYPSDFEPNNLLTAGRELKLPGEGVPYIFRLRERGRETIVAVCNAAGAQVDGIRHDFERQRFTDLGDYATFLAQAVSTEAEARRLEAKGVAPPADPRQKAKRRGATRAEPAATRPRPEQVSRTSVTFDVR